MKMLYLDYFFYSFINNTTLVWLIEYMYKLPLYTTKDKTIQQNILSAYHFPMT